MKNKKTSGKRLKMKEFNVTLQEHDLCTVEIPELKLKVVIEVLDAQIAEIGKGLNVLNTTLKVVSQTHDPDMVYNGVPSNQLSEDKLNKVSKFRIDVPARSRFKAETGEIIDVYAEPLIVKYSDTYINALGTPHYNITTMSGAVLVPER